MALKIFWNKSLAHVELITFKIHEFINMIVGQLPEEEEKKKKKAGLRLIWEKHVYFAYLRF